MFCKKVTESSRLRHGRGGALRSLEVISDPFALDPSSLRALYR